MIYRVHFIFEAEGSVQVEADSHEEALNAVEQLGPRTLARDFEESDTTAIAAEPIQECGAV